MTEGQLTIMLRNRHPKPEWVFMPQVRNGTGYTRGTVRTADAIAMGTYPSRGLDLHGFEIKVSRADLKKELAQPDKCESVCRFCDYWWIVAPAGVVHEIELPPTWGVLVPDGESLVRKIKAEKLSPIPLDRPFIASIFRSASEVVIQQADVDKAIEAARSAGYRDGWASAEKRRDERSEPERKEIDRLKKIISDFEEKAGIRIGAWNRGDVASAVRFVMDGGIERLRKELDDVAKKAAGISDAATNILKESHVASDFR